MARPKEFDPELAVDRAMEVFWTKGYGATTPQDLVDALGIGKGSLYNAFGSKQALVGAEFVGPTQTKQPGSTLGPR